VGVLRSLNLIPSKGWDNFSRDNTNQLSPLLSTFILESRCNRMSPSSRKPRVLLTGEIDWAHDEWNALSDVAALEVHHSLCYG
jgi:hypothetical protein